MNEEMTTLLRSAFDTASETIMPAADLADRVRQVTRRRRRRLAVLSTLAVAVLAAAGGYAAAGLSPGPDNQPVTLAHHPAGQRAKPRLIVPVPPGAGVAALAVAGQDLYVTTEFSGNPPYSLSAYNLLTGRLIRRVRLPAEPQALRTGPGGTVWVTFSPDQNGGPAGTWLLTPDLGRRSVSRAGPTDLLPTSRVTALLAWQYGLRELRMPSPGAPGRAVVHSDPSGAISGRFAVDVLAAVGGRVAASVTNGYGFHSHIVIAGHPGLSFGGTGSDVVGAMTAEDGGLWAITSAERAPYTGPLVRLSPDLRVITPGAVRANGVFRHSQAVWSAGHTVWVTTAAAGHQLVCFAYRGGRMGPVTAVRAGGEPEALAPAGNLVYVSFSGAEVGVTSGVVAYPVPAACR